MTPLVILTQSGSPSRSDQQSHEGGDPAYRQDDKDGEQDDKDGEQDDKDEEQDDKDEGQDKDGEQYDTRLVVFDAMGVLYAAGDDEFELLIPYLRELGCRLRDDEIDRAYEEASVGRLTSAEFWEICGVRGDDRMYCSRHTLTPGMDALLADLSHIGVQMACLSNDVSEWSRILRKRFGLEQWISTWVISGDIRAQKPDPEAFRTLAQRTGEPLDAMVFFDDSQRNVDAALGLGMDAQRFTSVPACRTDLRNRGFDI